MSGYARETYMEDEVKDRKPCNNPAEDVDLEES